ncbi:MAG: YifB family Mg chelatase-like AAA ATPase [Oscillospiraceae bacterium]
MYVKLTSAGLFGMNAYLVDVEIDLMRGMPSFDIVGLPDAAVKESRDRVRSAMKNCGYEVPVKKITVNLAPADLKKAGPMYDLPIFLALLAASGQTSADFSGSVFVGEVALDGTVRRIQGILPMVIEAKEAGFQRIFIPAENGREGSVVQGIEVYPIHKVQELVDFLENTRVLKPMEPICFEPSERISDANMEDVMGQEFAKRALEIAAAGGHNALLIGPPGSGKSMLAKRIPSILPDLTFEEAIETTKIHSIAGHLSENEPLVTQRPFRSPHHTVSPAGLSGGGTIPKPGEISLAHNGVLFLDELPEFSRPAMEILRQPIEEGTVTISRVNGTLTYPCNMMVIAAMNPCPCGYFGHPTRACNCSSLKVSQYLNKVSGPLLDRLDLHIEVAPVEFQHLSTGQKAESSAEIKKRVNKARKIQIERYANTPIYCNSNLTPHMLREFCVVSEQGMKALKVAFEKMGMSARGYDRILKVSRTIADLDGSEQIELSHISEALQYRSLDRKYWQHDK